MFFLVVRVWENRCLIVLVFVVEVWSLCFIKIYIGRKFIYLDGGRVRL